MGLTDVDLEYSDADLQEITNGKLFGQRYRQTFLDVNPSWNVTKMGPYITAKYRQFQEVAASRGISKKEKNKEAKDEKVAPLKIRISSRKSKKKDDDDRKFIYFINLINCNVSI